MKYKLLSINRSFRFSKVNIGDYIQALASSQYYPSVDGFIDRDEELKDYDGEPCKMIMNGWYMYNPKNWPPSKKIMPLFVAFHLNVLAKKELTTSQSISYFKAHEPIGCRDVNTVDILTSSGVRAYFSGCMTLTLGKKYHSAQKDRATYIVDPIMPVEFGVKSIYRACVTFVKHPLDIINLLKKKGLHLYEGRNVCKRIMQVALYYDAYSKILSHDMIMDSIYIHHYVDKSDNNYLLSEAERLVKMYARAKLVITSRIHCALPCLGLETPVIFLKKKNDEFISSCRFGGLEELFNMIEVGNNEFRSNFNMNHVISSENYPENMDSWKKYAKELNQRCESFTAE